MVEAVTKNEECLRLTIEGLVINTTDEPEALEEGGNFFCSIISYFDEEFKEVDEPRPLSQIKVNIYEVSKLSTFKQMFDSISCDTTTLCLKWSHVRRLIRAQREWLSTGYRETLFLLEESQKFFVVRMGFDVAKSPEVCISRFDSIVHWYPSNPSNRRYLVVPQPAKP